MAPDEVKGELAAIHSDDAAGDNRLMQGGEWDEIQQFTPLTTKLHVPPLRAGWISRPRLDKRMDEGFARKLTLLPELQLVIVEYYDSDLNWDDPGSDGFELTMLILDARLDK